jgi:hypothetical protein
LAVIAVSPRSGELGHRKQHEQDEDIENQAHDGYHCHALRPLAAALVTDGAENEAQHAGHRERKD